MRNEPKNPTNERMNRRLCVSVSLCVCVCVLTGCILGPDGGASGGSVSDGAGVRLPSSQVWPRGFCTGRAAKRPLSPLRHPAVWTDGHRDFHSVSAHAASHPRTGVYTQLSVETPGMLAPKDKMEESGEIKLRRVSL